MSSETVIPTQEELNKRLQDGILFLQQCSIPVSGSILPDLKLNYRAKTRLGCCIRKKDCFLIEISAICFDAQLLQEHPKLIEQTILHELLHTCPGCQNHGAQWKAYAASVNQLTGYSINRTIKIKMQKQKESPEKPYCLICENCGQKIARQKCTKVIINPELYRCKCGGKLKRIR